MNFPVAVSISGEKITIMSASVKKKLLFLFTKNLRVHMNSFTRVLAFQIELEFGRVGF